MSTHHGLPSPALSADVADLAWGPVTIRVAWTLLTLNVAPRPEILRDVRDHVWFHLDPATPVAAAEDKAERIVNAFVARAHSKPLEDPWPQDADMPLSPRWRTRLVGSLAPLASWVHRLHYADGIDLPRVAERTGEDLLAVEAAREGLREVVRRAGADDGVPLDAWPEARLDRLIHRLACMAADGGPSLEEIAQGRHPDWAQHCPRAARTLTLVQRGYLTLADLVPPTRGARPTDVVTLVALHFHRDARGQRLGLAKELNAITIPAGDDVLLVDGSNLEAIREVLVLAAEVATPSRDQLRGAVLRGPGRWSRHGLLGGLVDQVEPAIRSTAWGVVEGIGELPEPLPEPPSARGAWAATAALGLVTAVVVSFALQPEVPPITHPLRATAAEGRGGVWLDFDVDEDAYVLVVRERDKALDVVLESRDPADKIRLSSGDGSYLTHVRGEAVLIASSSSSFADLPSLINAAKGAERPVDALSTLITEQLPGADVWTWTQ